MDVDRADMARLLESGADGVLLSKLCEAECDSRTIGHSTFQGNGKVLAYGMREARGYRGVVWDTSIPKLSFKVRK